MKEIWQLTVATADSWQLTNSNANVNSENHQRNGFVVKTLSHCH